MEAVRAVPSASSGALVPSGHWGAIPRAVIEALLGAGAVVTSVGPALLAQVLWSSVQAL